MAGVEAADSESGVGLNREGAGGTHCANCAGARTQLLTNLSSCSPLKVVQAAVSFLCLFVSLRRVGMRVNFRFRQCSSRLRES